MSDELDGIFDNLTPEDFLVSFNTTAFQEIARVNTGLNAFNDFVEEQLRTLQATYAMTEGAMNPIAILANQHTQRLYLPSEEETVQNYLDRLTEEARAMDACWFFIARRTEVGAHIIEPDESHDVADMDVTKKAQESGALSPGVFWYAERREDEHQRRMGIFFDNNGVLERPVEVPDNPQPIAILEQVLRR